MKHTVYTSTVINAPIEKVWPFVRDFNGLPSWHFIIDKSTLEGNKLNDQVGAIRHLEIKTDYVREQLLMLDDDDFAMKYSILDTSTGTYDFIAGIKLYRVTDTNQTFVEWWGDFKVKPNFDEKETLENVKTGVFVEGLKNLKKASE